MANGIKNVEPVKKYGRGAVRLVLTVLKIPDLLRIQQVGILLNIPDLLRIHQMSVLILRRLNVVRF